jgi:uncharacterized membrane protein YfcA
MVGMHPLEFVLAGLGVGTVFGLFGAGGSAFATPLLALMGVPGLLAVASPLPAMLPASITGARRHMRNGTFDRRVAVLAVVGGVPGTAVGALASTYVGGDKLLVLSGLMLIAVGARVAWPDRAGHAASCAARRDNRTLLVGASFGAGLLTGLLANGGGFLLVPLFIVGFGLATNVAAGTSMVVVGILTIPTLATHWALGHVDWPVALAFGLGLVPGSMIGAGWSARVPELLARRGFGVLLVAFAVGFLALQLG